jgi:hypothetical protein|tara:strand:+ start:3961 stop:4383 length:423 start_codon:yes stop_codon:yes gene_type:complete
MSWLFESNEIEALPEDCVGFVYLITNLTNNRKYIGKKLARFKTSKPPLKGRKNRRRGTKESDWREYYGSNDELNKDIEQLGTENFQREILYYCNSKAECSYIEAREQFRHKVLETPQYYNGHIQVRVHGSHIINKLSSNG